MIKHKRKVPRTLTRQEEQWSEHDVTRLLTNPFYCIRVDPKLTGQEPPFNTDYVRQAGAVIRQEGARVFVYNLLQKLKDHSYPVAEALVSGLNIHPAFADAHDAVISEEKFIRIAEQVIDDVGPETYVVFLLENLKGNSPSGWLDWLTS